MRTTSDQKPVGSTWPPVPLGELLSRSEEQVDIWPDRDYLQVTVRLWGNGVTLRNEVSGAKITAKKRYVVRSQQFILSRIDARNGAFGLIPNELDGAVVSNDFPTFNINQKLLEPHYLEWMSKTKWFVSLCRDASEGTTNRVRLQVDRFLEIEIPLPPLEEQRRIVAHIEAISARVEEARRLRQEAVEEVRHLVDATLDQIIERGKGNWTWGPISEFAEVNPPRKGQVNLSDTEMVSFVPMSAVDDVTGEITYAEPRPLHEVKRGYKWFVNGDVIFARITPSMQNGKSALAKELHNGVGFGSTEFHVLRPGPRILGEWLHKLVRSNSFRQDAASHFKGTAGQQRVPKSFLEQKVIPLPPLAEQRRIVAYLDELQARVNELRKYQVETQAALDALMPSVLQDLMGFRET